MQTAYSAILQARQSEAPFAFVQGAKLLTSMGQALRGLQELQHTLDPLLPAALNAATGRQVTQTGGQLTPLSKVCT
jgi:alanyl-tRNA synthetase